MKQIHWICKFLIIYLVMVVLITLVGILTPIVNVTYEGWFSYLVNHYIGGAFVVGGLVITFVLPVVLVYKLIMS